MTMTTEGLLTVLIALTGLLVAIIYPLAKGWTSTAKGIATLVQWTKGHDKETEKLSKSVHELWRRTDDHETRLSHVEATCVVTHGRTREIVGKE